MILGLYDDHACRRASFHCITPFLAPQHEDRSCRKYLYHGATCRSALSRRISRTPPEQRRVKLERCSIRTNVVASTGILFHHPKPPPNGSFIASPESVPPSDTRATSRGTPPGLTCSSHPTTPADRRTIATSNQLSPIIMADARTGGMHADATSSRCIPTLGGAHSYCDSLTRVADDPLAPACRCLYASFSMRPTSVWKIEFARPRAPQQSTCVALCVMAADVPIVPLQLHRRLLSTRPQLRSSHSAGPAASQSPRQLPICDAADATSRS